MRRTLQVLVPGFVCRIITPTSRYYFSRTYVFPLRYDGGEGCFRVVRAFSGSLLVIVCLRLHHWVDLLMRLGYITVCLF